ncbi:MAG: 3-hydroxyacyl-[acyl-carrier-protein] dehydratase FabZ [Alphaproteobacteria bacterium]|nr:3-hydroxyacyl-[acyl-carrier-protein] dehydratase FabZ [Alphaproteobacteria bacterium]
MMNIQEIMKLIPHRYPFLLVDKVISISNNSLITGIKNVTINEPYFVGHFPDNPVMPGVLIIEAMAQVSGLLVAHILQLSTEQNRQVILMSINNAKFRKIVKPGDVLELNSSITQNRGNVWKFSANAKVEGSIVAECELMAMIRGEE